MIEKVKSHWKMLILISLSIAIIWPVLLPGYFSHHDDLQVMRIFEMRKCLEDFQLPCRWVPDMGYGNGFPLFNYYGVLPYYMGAFFSFFVGYLMAAKWLFIIVLFFGGLSMYLLIRELYGEWPGVVAGVLYLLAPYRAVDSYVRGAIAESFSIMLIPLVFWGLLKVAQRGERLWSSLAIASLGAFLISHNIMTLFFVPVVGTWVIFLGIRFKRFKRLMLTILLSFGLASFFLLPAFVEKGLVQSDSLTRFELNFRAHFVSIKQLFVSRFWGYGASVEGPWDGLSFQIGWPHWWIVVLLPVVIVGKVILGWGAKIGKYTLGLSGLTLALFFASAFMMHNKSAFIWESIEVLKYAQFPWRFLSLSIFASSIIGGIFIYLLPKKVRAVIGVLIIVSTVYFNINYFRPEKFYFSLTEKEKLSGELWIEQKRSAILDYLPKTALEPREEASLVPEVIEGSAKIEEFNNRSNRWGFKARVNSRALIELPVFYFPDWRVFVDSKEHKLTHDNFLGRIRVELDGGNHTVQGRLYNTLVRDIANLISLSSLLGFVLYLVYGKNRKAN